MDFTDEEEKYLIQLLKSRKELLALDAFKLKQSMQWYQYNLCEDIIKKIEK